MISTYVIFGCFVLLLCLFGFYIERNARQMDREREEWRLERQELLTRLQHPNLVPIPRTRADENKIKEGEKIVDPFAEEADELGKVGTIIP